MTRVAGGGGEPQGRLGELEGHWEAKRKTDQRAHWLRIPGHEEWDTGMEDLSAVVGKLITLSK